MATSGVAKVEWRGLLCPKNICCNYLLLKILKFYTKNSEPRIYNKNLAVKNLQVPENVHCALVKLYQRQKIGVKYRPI